LKFDEYKKENQVNTTLAHQLALYVVIYSPIQMACDLPEHYMVGAQIHPAFQFIRDVGVDWEQSKVLGGEVGDFVIIAREEKNTGNWFVGGITDENSRIQKVDFGFLPQGKKFTATLYKDGPNAHWNDNPAAYAIDSLEIDKSTILDITLASGGGFAISLIAK
jgi:hypothetical protein